MKNILLVGILGTYNYGCEAIVRGTVAILRVVNPQVNITYVSYDYNNDIIRLKDLNINIKRRPSKFKRWTLGNFLWKIARMCHLPIIRPYDTTGWIKGYDTVFSIGGDMYTLSSTGAYKRDLPLFFEKCQAKGLKYVLWGASVGPFEKNNAARNFYINHLKKADLIVARERNTIEYLNSLGIINNVIYAPDPAYFVPFSPMVKNKEILESRFRVGINLSPLSAKHAYNDISRAIMAQSNVIKYLIEKGHCDIVLLPHVVSPRYWEDDLDYLKEIYNSLPSDMRRHVSLIDNDPGFVGLKSILQSLDVVLTARMHCGINAITCGTPVVFLSYSEKSKGMAYEIYGNYDYVLPLKDFENKEAILNVINAIKNNNIKYNIDKLLSFNFNQIFSSI